MRASRVSSTAGGVPGSRDLTRPLAAVRSGDRIRLSIKERRIDLLVDPAEVARRLEGFTPPPAPARGYKALYRRTVTQAPLGCDFDFLMGAPGEER